MRYTGNYNLKKPEGTDVVNIEDFNGNSDIIDLQLKNLNDKIFSNLNQVHWLGTVTGTNTLVSTYKGIPSLAAGVAVTFKNTTANTGSVTLNINSLGAKQVKKVNGDALNGGDLVAGGLYNVVYDGTSFFLVGGGSGGNSDTPFQSHKYLIKPTANGQTKFKIDLATFTESDFVMVFQNRTFLESTDYTITKELSSYYINLTEGVQDFENTSLSVIIIKGQVVKGVISDIPAASTTQVGLVSLTDVTGTSNELAVTQKLFTDKTNALTQEISKTKSDLTTIIDQNKTDLSQQINNATADLSIIKKNKDAEGIFTTVELRRKTDQTLHTLSVLSEGTSPNYTKRTITKYEANGTTVKDVQVFQLTYDEDGLLIGEV